MELSVEKILIWAKTYQGENKEALDYWINKHAVEPSDQIIQRLVAIRIHSEPRK